MQIEEDADGQMKWMFEPLYISEDARVLDIALREAAIYEPSFSYTAGYVEPTIHIGPRIRENRRTRWARIKEALDL